MIIAKGRVGAFTVPVSAGHKGQRCPTPVATCHSTHLESFLQQVHDALGQCLPKYYFASPICGFAYMHRVALGLERCGSAVNPAPWE